MRGRENQPFLLPLLVSSCLILPRLASFFLILLHITSSCLILTHLALSYLVLPHVTHVQLWHRNSRSVTKAHKNSHSLCLFLPPIPTKLGSIMNQSICRNKTQLNSYGLHRDDSKVLSLGQMHILLFLWFSPPTLVFASQQTAIFGNRFQWNECLNICLLETLNRILLDVSMDKSAMCCIIV